MIYNPAQWETEEIVFGSGFDQYSWWQKLARLNEWEYDADLHAPHGWGWVVTVDDPHEDSTREVTVTHSVIRAAVRKITDGRAAGVSPQTLRECRNFQFRHDQVDFDANVADEVMQVATLGAVYFG